MARDRDDQAIFDGTNLDSLPRWLRDMIELNMAALETGRIKRFPPADANDRQGLEKKREKDRAFSALLRLFLDPAYAKLYGDAAASVTRADEAAARAARSKPSSAT